MASVSYTQPEAFQAYVREYSMDIFRKLYYGFKTAQLTSPFEGVKGQLVLNEAIITGNLIKRWTKNFEPVVAASIAPVILETALNKIDFSVVPQEYERSYLGKLRQKGQNPTDWPFEAFLLESVMKQANIEMEQAIWKGVKTGAPAVGDNLTVTFNGFLKLIADAVTATTLTPRVTGAITSSNAVTAFRNMWNFVGEAEKDQGVDILCSYAIYDNYRIHYKTLYGANPAETEVINNAGYAVTGMRFELGGGDTNIIPLPGLSGSGRVIMTPRGNLVHGMDSPSDLEWNSDQDVRTMRFWTDFRMGCQILMARDTIMTINDQA